jgi:hypothetical protein
VVEYLHSTDECISGHRCFWQTKPARKEPDFPRYDSALLPMRSRGHVSFFFVVFLCFDHCPFPFTRLIEVVASLSVSVRSPTSTFKSINFFVSRTRDEGRETCLVVSDS